MQWIALYKTLRGGEWIQASLNSIYKHMDAIVIVHSNVLWGRGNYMNNCVLEVFTWRKTHAELMLYEFLGPFYNQDSQYEMGYNWIKRQFGNCYVLLIDADEIWEERDILKLKEGIQQRGAPAYSCRMRTYIKSPFYRIDPPEICEPIVVIDTGKVPFINGPRGANIYPRALLQNVYMHHFTYVRANFEDIKVKFYTSSHGDNAPSHEDWFDRVWPRIPDTEDFHPSIGHEKSWHSIKKIGKKELPAAIQDHPLVLKNEK